MVYIGITDAERELDELRISSEKERRVISDLKTQKTMLEGELGRLSEEIRFNTEQNLHGAMRKSEIEVYCYFIFLLSNTAPCIWNTFTVCNNRLLRIISIRAGESAERKGRNESISAGGSFPQEKS